jgi:hypothetical protein
MNCEGYFFSWSRPLMELILVGAVSAGGIILLVAACCTVAVFINGTKKGLRGGR